jgi:hypothetical protein
MHLHMHACMYTCISLSSLSVVNVLWFLRCIWVLYPECGIMGFRGRSLRNAIIPHEGYNPYTFENHSTADLYYDATNQTLGSISTILYYAARVYALIHTLLTSRAFEVWLHHTV